LYTRIGRDLKLSFEPCLLHFVTPNAVLRPTTNN